jgi:hypothetical protein
MPRILVPPSLRISTTILIDQVHLSPIPYPLSMSLLFTHLAENNYPEFDRELNRDPYELDDCYEKVIQMHDIGLLRRFENFVSQSTGKEFSLQKLITRAIKEKIATDYPHAKPGDRLTLQINNLKLEITINPDGGFTQTIPQIMESFGLSREQVESHLFSQQIDNIGTKPKSNYLDITRTFAHPLSEVRQYDGLTLRNNYATASTFINYGYLNPIDEEGGKIARRSIEKIIGASLDISTEQELYDRYLPTLFQVANQIAEAMNSLGDTQ